MGADLVYEAREKNKLRFQSDGPRRVAFPPASLSSELEPPISAASSERGGRAYFFPEELTRKGNFNRFLLCNHGYFIIKLDAEAT